MAGHSPSKTGVNALLSRPSTSFDLRDEDVDATATRLARVAYIMACASRVYPTCDDKRGHDAEALCVRYADAFAIEAVSMCTGS
jgi:hypothetical protein